MTSAPARDRLAGHLLTPVNAGFLFAGCRPARVASVRWMGHALLVKNAVATVRAITAFGIPVVPSIIKRPRARGWLMRDRTAVHGE